MYGTQLPGGNPSFGHNGGPPLTYDADPMRVSDAEQRIWQFFTSQLSHIERQTFEVEYPDIRYPQLVPVDTSADQWTQVVTYYSSDRVGQAQWFHANANDVPLVSATRNRFDTTVQMAAIGYDYNEEELAIAARLGSNLTADKAQICRRAAEEFIDRVALFGDASMGFVGLCNSTAVTAGSVPADGTAGATTWASKTPALILRDVNAGLVGVWTNSRTIEMADTMLLPLTQYADVATRRMSDLDSTTILNWLRQNNAYTAETGRPLTIRAMRGLETIGSGSTARMIMYRRSPDVVKMHMPMPFQFRAPWRKGPLRFEVPGIFRLGGVDIRRPAAFRYFDGV